MTLVSLTFIGFLMIVLLVYYLLPKKWQWVILLLGSIFFFFLAGTPVTVIYLIASIVSVFIGTLLMEKKSEKKKLIYVLTLLINLGMLIALKYTNFLLDNIFSVLKIFSDAGTESFRVRWIAPLGISFYALQMIGYLTDCYWGIAERQKNIAKLALFNMYFPQMVSGPINKYNNIENSLFGEHCFSGERLSCGLFRILQGFFKKLVVSEQLTALVDYLYSNYTFYDGIYVWIGTALYVIQIYADFSGCMDIVLGASECFGVTLTENFKAPFSSLSVQEFWQRFHISLGAWLKDYIMYPMLRSKGLSKISKKLKAKHKKKAAKLIPTFIAMFFVWFLMGLWHGGGWNFIGEGIWFWLLIVLSQLLETPFKKLSSKLKINTESGTVKNLKCVGTSFCFGIGILFFKASSLTAAFSMLGSAFNPIRVGESVKTINDSLQLADSSFGTNRIMWMVISLLIGIIFMIISGKADKSEERLFVRISRKSVGIKVAIVYLFIITIILFGAYGPGYSASEFIYGGF